MKITARLAGIGGFALASTALIAGPATASPAHHEAHHRSGRESAVFVQTDNTGGNTIVAYDRSTTGHLTRVGAYPTGGLGGVLTGSAVDHTASEGSLALDRAHGLLYAVNAGSDTVTVFSVHGDRLTRRQVISSGGHFPVSIAVHGNLVYVLNARDGGSIQGYRRVGHRLALATAWHRRLGLDATATPEFTHTPGQIAFTPDGSRLVVTTKANGNDIDVFAVDQHGAAAATPMITLDAGAVPFGVTFDARGNLAVAEAGTNAVATFTIRPDGKLSLINRSATGQAATCWIVDARGGLYASNAGSASLTGYRDEDGALTALGNTTTDAGTVDATTSSDGRYLYVQAGAAGIVDGFRVNADGSLSPLGSVTVPGAIGGEGIAAS
jgi:6-phosphogluconolactonase (cycloisomerase 2 family)